jgi:predicted  nucleic acid-binding Zn-ribbon protein
MTNEKLARIFSNPKLKDPEYIAKQKEIEDLESRIRQLEQQRNSQDSTSSEWQRLDKEIFEMYDRKRELNK